MSGGASNFAPAPDQEWSPWDYFFDVALPSPAVLPLAVSYRTTPPGPTRTRSFVPERVMSWPTPSSLAGFTTPSSPFTLLENAYARPRTIVEPPPRSIGQPTAQILSEQDSMLTGDEQKKVLSKLKKEVYNPLPKSFIRRVSLYYRENARNGLGDQNRYRDEDDGKRCAICLDDFEPKQEVMVTPCDHMFHEDCIVPWLQGHSQCPVCRFSLLEQKSSWCEGRLEAAAAGVCRDEHGAMGGFALKIRVKTPLIAETLAMREGLRFLKGFERESRSKR